MHAHNLRWVLLVIGLALATEAAAAQSSCNFARPQTKAGQGSSTAVGQQQDLTGSSTPTRVTEKRTESGNRTVVTRTLETISVDGSYAPVAVCEEEITKTDAKSQRVNQRSFGFDADGHKVLLETFDEQRRQLANGGEDVVRTVSRPDESGKMRVTKRELEQTQPAGTNAQETKTTVQLPDVNGGMVTSGVTRELRRQTAPGVEEVRSTQLLPDGNGGWQTSEVKEETVRTDPSGNRAIDRRVFRPDANLKLSLAERQVIHDTREPNGSEQRQVQTFGQSTMGAIGSIDLDSSMKVVRSNLPGGGQKTSSTIQQRDPVAPANGLQTTQTTVGISRPNDRGGTDSKRTTSVTDPNGNVTQITVSFGEQQPTK